MKKVILLFLTLSSLQARYTSRSSLSIAHINPFDAAHDFFIPITTDNPGHYQKRISSSFFAGATCDTSGMARYILPFDKTSLLVAEASGTGELNTGFDLIAENFGVRTVNGNFRSTLSFNPKQIVYGSNIALSLFKTESYWFELSIPVMHVKNRLGMEEAKITLSGGADTAQNTLDNSASQPTMVAAFKNSKMKYGKIDDNASAMQKTGIADITLRVGKALMNKENRYAAMHFGVLMPMGNKPTGEYLFEAVVGNNDHFGAQVGLNYGLRLKEADCCAIWLSGNMQSTYLFANQQMRSFDLINKPWGRYLSIYATDAQRIATNITKQTWGINYFTQAVNVRPNMNVEFNGALHFMGNAHQKFTIGCQNFLKASERVSLASAWNRGLEFGDLNDGVGSNSVRGINNTKNTAAIAQALYITTDHLDLESAAQPMVSESTWYAMGEKEYYKGNNLISVKAGAAYTFSILHNAAPSRWNMMVQIGLQF